MDLEPFNRINPCGYAGMAVTRLTQLADKVDPDAARAALTEILVKRLGYTELTRKTTLD